MSDYISIISGISMFIGGIYGFFYWVGTLSSALNDGNTLGFVILLIFSGILIPLNGIIPFIIWFLILFIAGLPFYGLYKLLKKS